MTDQLISLLFGKGALFRKGLTSLRSFKWMFGNNLMRHLQCFIKGKWYFEVNTFFSEKDPSAHCMEPLQMGNIMS